MEDTEPLRKGLGSKLSGKLEIVETNLLDAKSIAKAIKDCVYVIHTASPPAPEKFKHESEIIDPALFCTQAVLDACDMHKVKRLVVTSSIVTIYDPEEAKRFYDESDYALISKSTPIS
jgi:dihydroflavonol-4-reductase